MSLVAGAAVREITPPGPTALAGYPHVDRVSEGVHDPLLAAALFLQNGRQRMVVIGLDILLLDTGRARRMRRAVARRCGLAESRVFISCTHTHSGPVTGIIAAWENDPAVPPPDPAYMRLVEERVVEAAAAAQTSAVPARLAWTSADARGVGGNRHRPDGVTDPECGVLAVRNCETGDMIAISLVYGMHPTVLHEDSRLVSSDFPHYARALIRERFGTGLPVQYHMGPAGNQSPRFHVQGQTFAEAERLGRMLGEAAAKAVADLALNSWTDDPPLSAGMVRVTLPARTMPDVAEAERLFAEYRAEYERLKAAGAPRPEVRTAECAIFGAEGTLALAQAQADGRLAALIDEMMPAEVQALRIGPACLVGLPGELFAEYALQIKSQAAMRVFVASLVNGSLQGYIVTPAAAAAGGYEAKNALMAAEAGTVLVKTALDLVARLATGDRQQRRS